MKTFSLTSFPRCITNLKRFKKSLKEIRDEDYACEHDEAVRGLIGIGAPIRNDMDKAISAIGAGISKFKTDDQKIKEDYSASKTICGLNLSGVRCY